MSLRLGSDSELAAVVPALAVGHGKRASCMLQTPTVESVLDPAAREIVVSWIRDGGYDRAVAEVVADDPDIADQ